MKRTSLLHTAIAAALLTVSASFASAQTLTIGVRGGPDSVDPHFTATGTHAETLKHVFDTLVWSGDGLEIEPRLAESWKAIDPTTWEFKLKRGVKFHDGSDFTAEDVKFSMARMATPMGPNPTTIYVRRVKETKVVDPHTLHVITDGPAPNLPNDFIRLFVVSHKAAAGLTKDNANEAFNNGKAAIGTGPYKFVSWTPKGDFVVERFDGYWGGKEPWARVVRKEIPNDAARVAQLKAGQLDLITRVPASDIATLERDPKVTVTKIDTVYVFNIEIDMREQPPAGQISAKDGSPLPKNPYLDSRVREAIDLAIDRKALAEIAMEGLGKPVNQLVTPSIFGYNKALPERKYDVAAAKKLMTEAGYPNGFETTLSFDLGFATVNEPTAVLIQESLGQIGIKTTINKIPGSNFRTELNKKVLPLYLNVFSGWLDYPEYFFIWCYHGKNSIFNTMSYQSKDMDAMIDGAVDAAAVGDKAKYEKDVKGFVDLAFSDLPRIPLFQPYSNVAMQKNISGYEYWFHRRLDYRSLVKS
jgi:peptide/nickel transport system substrate-binding protein